MRTHLTGGLIAVTLTAAATVASAQGYNDGTGREWRQVSSTTGMSWSQVASVCPTVEVSRTTAKIRRSPPPLMVNPGALLPSMVTDRVTSNPV